MRGQDLWARAKQIIPGGNQLLSKRTEIFLPGLWPAYYTHAKGCEVWDMEGRHYYDFAQMGVGSCILGYADNDVNNSVIEAIKKGGMCTLNCYEEVELAEKLISFHPWADMVRFAKTGGEACAIAVRIARAASGKSKVAFCGYHGWHDWYLSANIGESSALDGQLLPGLEPNGIPRELMDTCFPFAYNNLSELKAIISCYPNDIGVIIMEPRRGTPPDEGFLKGVRDISKKIGAVLIFDEVTSGFRMNLGGIHLEYGINPDLAIFGKALGNGFPISAVIGRKEIMDAAQNTFISSTMWTERTGYVAALATLYKMENLHVQSVLVSFGNRINSGWNYLSEKYCLPININGIPPLTHISFKGNNPLALQTLYAQEMLERGYLLGAAIYSSFSYTDEIIDRFISCSDAAFAKMKEAIDSGDVLHYLKNDIIQSGFKRLT